MSRLSLEHAFTKYAEIEAPSPLQTAICRAAEGRPLDGVLDANALHEYFGIEAETVLTGAPRLVAAVCGVRSAKTTLGISDCVVCVFESDLSALRPGERARAVIVGPHSKPTDHTFAMLVSMFERSPVLKKTIVERRDRELVVRRPKDGREVEIIAVAAHASGVTLRGAWLCFFMLEETASFYSEVSGYKISAEELLRAAEPRLVPGGRGWIIGSPRGPEGLLYDLHKRHFGRPGRVLVVHAPTIAMNPRIDAAEIEALRERDPDAAAREYDAAWVDAESTYYTQTEIDDCTRKEPLELGPEPNWSYVMTSDPATRGNGWTFGVIGAQRQKDRTLRFKVALVREWRGSQQRPLSPGMVLAEVAPIARRFKITRCYADQHSSDALADLAAHVGLKWVRMDVVGGVGGRAAAEIDGQNPRRRNRTQLFEEFKAVLATRTIELPPHKVLRADLLGVKRRVTPVGFNFHLPETPDGRHGDFVPVLMLGITVWPDRHDRIAIEAQRARIASMNAHFDLLNGPAGAEWAAERHELRLAQPWTRDALAENAAAVEESRNAAELALEIAERN
ncbi:MAG TPA: hypothetical protein VGH28_26835 [Polyangiaceae bacterium]|jgi:hypothetical protein